MKYFILKEMKMDKLCRSEAGYGFIVVAQVKTSYNMTARTACFILPIKEYGGSFRFGWLIVADKNANPLQKKQRIKE